MAGPYLYDRVCETTTTTGTGTLTLLGAVTGYRTFSVVGDGNSVVYGISEVDASGVPSGAWEVVIGTYTASGTTLSRTTILASSNGGAAVSFGAGTKRVYCDLPADFATRFLHPTAAYSSLAAYQAGRLCLPSDGLSLLRDTGSALAPWGPLWPLTDPTAQTWAWVNQGSATVASGPGSIYLECVSNGSAYGIRLRKKAAPSTPYTITAGCLFNYDYAAGGNADFGIAFRQSSDGKLALLNFDMNSSAASFPGGVVITSKKMTDANTFSANYNIEFALAPLSPLAWLRIADDGANRICSLSADGLNWITLHSVGRTDFLTANEVGFYVNPYSAKSGVTLLSWREG